MSRKNRVLFLLKTSTFDITHARGDNGIKVCDKKKTTCQSGRLFFKVTCQIKNVPAKLAFNTKKTPQKGNSLNKKQSLINLFSTHVRFKDTYFGKRVMGVGGSEVGGTPGMNATKILKK